MTDSIDHPDHYQGCSELTRPIVKLIIPLRHTQTEPGLLDQECIEVIERFNLGFLMGSALWYLWQCGQKGDPLEDLQKARWYLERYGLDRGVTAVDELIEQISKSEE